jgi:hypothetical protein
MRGRFRLRTNQPYGIGIERRMNPYVGLRIPGYARMTMA